MLETKQPDLSQRTSPQCTESLFLARQPILDRRQSLIGYELLYRRSGTGPATVTDDLAATSCVMLNTTLLGIDQVLGGMRGFINVDTAILMSDVIQYFSKEKVVLEILETVDITDELIERVAKLYAAGYTFALDDVVSNTREIQALMPFVSIIKIDVMNMAKVRLISLSEQFKRANKSILAEKVETYEVFQQCLACGFDFFQGYYFAKPTLLRGRKLKPSQANVIKLINLLTADAETAEIEICIKQSAALSLSLLKIVNTLAYGEARLSRTIREALSVMGRNKLLRWLQISLYAESNTDNQFISPLFIMATTRGRLLDLITAELRPGNRTASDIAFTVGVMSLLDALLGIPMKSILEEIYVDDEIRQALSKRNGFYGGLLKIVEEIEVNDTEAMQHSMTSTTLPLTFEKLLEMQHQAFEWAIVMSRSA